MPHFSEFLRWGRVTPREPFVHEQNHWTEWWGDIFDWCHVRTSVIVSVTNYPSDRLVDRASGRLYKINFSFHSYLKFSFSGSLISSSLSHLCVPIGPGKWLFVLSPPLIQVVTLHFHSKICEKKIELFSSTSSPLPPLPPLYNPISHKRFTLYPGDSGRVFPWRSLRVHTHRRSRLPPLLSRGKRRRIPRPIVSFEWDCGDEGEGVCARTHWKSACVCECA